MKAIDAAWCAEAAINDHDINHAAPGVPPTALAIGDLGISQGVLPVGLNDDGTMEVPDVSDIGWYLHGATPGRPDATVLVAHVWWGDTAGPFHRLGALEPGARIEVAGDGDTVHEYVVVERTSRTAERTLHPSALGTRP
jgi:hypothetical protein